MRPSLRDTCGAVSLVLLLACTSAQARLSQDGRKQFAAGDYDGAVFKAIEALRKSPDHEDAQQLLSESLAPAVRAHRARIAGFGSPSAPEHFDNLVAELTAIEQLRSAVQTLPALQSKVGAAPRYVVEDAALELTKARVGAADAHYKHAVQFVKSPDLRARRAAAREFVLVQTFMPGFKDAAARYEQTRQSSLTRVLFAPTEDPTGSGTYANAAEVIVAQVEEGLSKDSAAMEFTQLITHGQLSGARQQSIPDGHPNAVQLGRSLKAHVVVVPQVMNVEYNAPEEEVAQSPRAAYVVVETREVTDSKGNKVTEEIKDSVRAVFIQRRIRSGASISIGYRIIDVATGRLAKVETLTGVGNFNNTWAEVAGDKRALNFLERTLATGTRADPPTREQLIKRAAQDAAAKVILAVSSYLRQ